MHDFLTTAVEVSKDFGPMVQSITLVLVILSFIRTRRELNDLQILVSSLVDDRINNLIDEETEE